MNNPLVLDTNLLMLLIVGATSRDYISIHKRLANDFTTIEYEMLVDLIGSYSDIVLLPHVVAETSSLVRQVRNPIRREIQVTLIKLIMATVEYPIASVYGAQRDEVSELGITNSVILHFLSLEELHPTLMTIDGGLLNRASALGYRVVDCRSEFWA